MHNETLAHVSSSHRRPGQINYHKEVKEAPGKFTSSDFILVPISNGGKL
jgi:hypothetical protein